MLEYCVAFGLGLWFVAMGIVAIITLNKDFK